MYLLWSRKLRGLGLGLLHFTGLCGVYVGVYYLAWDLAATRTLKFWSFVFSASSRRVAFTGPVG